MSRGNDAPGRWQLRATASVARAYGSSCLWVLPKDQGPRNTSERDPREGCGADTKAGSLIESACRIRMSALGHLRTSRLPIELFCMRLFVVVQGDEIVVTSETGFRAAYCKRPNFPQLKVRRRTDTDDDEPLARAWQAANAKARELGWIGIRGALPNPTAGTPDPIAG